MRPEPLIPPQIWMPVVGLVVAVLWLLPESDPERAMAQAAPASAAPVDPVAFVDDIESESSTARPPLDMPQEPPNPAERSTSVGPAPTTPTPNTPPAEARQESRAELAAPEFWIAWNDWTRDEQVHHSERDPLLRAGLTALHRRAEFASTNRNLWLHWEPETSWFWVSLDAEPRIPSWLNQLRSALDLLASRLLDELDAQPATTRPIPVLYSEDCSVSGIFQIGANHWIELDSQESLPPLAAARGLVSEWLRLAMTQRFGNPLPLWMHGGLVEWALVSVGFAAHRPQDLPQRFEQVVLQSQADGPPEELSVRWQELSAPLQSGACELITHAMRDEPRFLDFVRAVANQRVVACGGPGLATVCDWYGVQDLAVLDQRWRE